MILGPNGIPLGAPPESTLVRRCEVVGENYKMPLPLAEKLCKTVATMGVVLAAEDGEKYLPELELWLKDIDVQAWVSTMIRVLEGKKL